MKTFPAILIALLLPALLPAQTVRFFETLNALQTVNPSPAAGTLCRTTGYYAPGDGGGAFYQVKAGNGTSDEASSVGLSQPGQQAFLLPENSEINLRQFGAKGDGFTDDRAAFGKALNFLGQFPNHHLFIPGGQYLISGYVLFQNLSNCRITGDGQAIIRYPSANTALVGDGTALISSQARSGFLVKSCTGLVFEGLHFQGDTLRVLDINSGTGICLADAHATTIAQCRQTDGAALVTCDHASDGLALSQCFSYNCMGCVNPCENSVISGCFFELDDSPRLDHVKKQGASHAIYIFASSRGSITVQGCHFKNIRLFAVKASGTSNPVRNVLVTGNQFINCGGGVAFGGDDFQEHTGLTVSNNIFTDCGTGRAGFNQQAAVHIEGSKGVLIADNQFVYTREAELVTVDSKGVPKSGVGSIMGIHAFQRDSNYSFVLSDLVIRDNLFYTVEKPANAPANVQPSALNAFHPAEVLLTAISVHDCNAFSNGRLLVQNNTIRNLGTQGFDFRLCGNLELKNNSVTNAIKFGSVTGSALPVITGNRFSTGDASTNNAQLVLTANSWLTYADNFTPELGGKTLYRNFFCEYEGKAGGLMPLRGVAGMAKNTGGKQEVVFAYGAGWVKLKFDTLHIDSVGQDKRLYPVIHIKRFPADTVWVNEVPFGYGTDFNTFDGLKNAINQKFPNQIQASDYGEGLIPGGIKTNHLRLVWLPTETVNNKIQVRKKTRRRTACVLLENVPKDTPNPTINPNTDMNRTFSRGADIANPFRVVVWSPYVFQPSTILLTGFDKASSAALAQGYARLRNLNDDGCCAEMDAGTSRAEVYEWGLR